MRNLQIHPTLINFLNEMRIRNILNERDRVGIETTNHLWPSFENLKCNYWLLLHVTVSNSFELILLF